VNRGNVSSNYLTNYNGDNKMTLNQLRKTAEEKEKKDFDIQARKVFGLRKNKFLIDYIYCDDKEIYEKLDTHENLLFADGYECAVRAVETWKKELALLFELDEKDGMISTEIIRKKLDELIQD
jgi:hypothetical protein